MIFLTSNLLLLFLQHVPVLWQNRIPNDAMVAHAQKCLGMCSLAKLIQRMLCWAVQLCRFQETSEGLQQGAMFFLPLPHIVHGILKVLCWVLGWLDCLAITQTFPFLHIALVCLPFLQGTLESIQYLPLVKVQLFSPQLTCGSGRAAGAGGGAGVWGQAFCRRTLLSLLLRLEKGSSTFFGSLCVDFAGASA